MRHSSLCSLRLRVNSISAAGRSATRAAASLGALVVLAAPGAQAAAGHPPLMPTQDATVTYNVQPDGQAARVVTVHFGGQGRLLRIDAPPNGQGGQPGNQGYAVIDRARRSVTVVMNPQHGYIELDTTDDMHNPFMLDATMSFTRTGTSTVAGVPCTLWSITAGKGTDSTACVTETGLVLSEKGTDSRGRRGQMEAVSVSLAPSPASDFAPPPGYTRLAHPAPQSPVAPMAPGQASTASGLPPVQTGPVQ